MWKKVLVGVAVLLVILFAVVASRPATYRIERSARIAAPPRAVYDRITDFHRWPEWSPWAHVDPNMKQSFEGAPFGTGAEYAWSGNSRIGEGRMSIIEEGHVPQIRMAYLAVVACHSVNGVAALPRVDILLVYQGAPGDLIKAAVDGGAKGIVIAVAGAGAIASDQSAGLEYAASKGVIIGST